MIKLSTVLSYALLLAPAVSIHTGFSYGAFWGNNDSAKTYDDFHTGFSLAQTLAGPVKFNSARLFSSMVYKTTEMTPAFDAAVATNTSLLLGFWISAEGSITTNMQIASEIAALGKGFEKHGQKLADLVIGLSVGSEDIYRFLAHEPGKPGRSEADVSAAIKKVKQDIAASPFAKFMQGKPIGHVDVAANVVVEGADFYGFTAYPYWHNDSIANGRDSFTETLQGVKQRAGNTPVIIGEMGWPFEGVQRGEAIASAQNMQTFWNEVGCTVVGQHTTFWFELIRDAELDQPDWALIDPQTNQLRINLSCPDPFKPAPPANSPPAQSPPAQSPPAKSPPAQSPPAKSPPAQSPPAQSPPANSPPANSSPSPITPTPRPSQASTPSALAYSAPPQTSTTPTTPQASASSGQLPHGRLCKCKACRVQKSTKHVSITITITVRPASLISTVGKEPRTTHVTETITVTVPRSSPTQAVGAGSDDTEDAEGDEGEEEEGDGDEGEEGEGEGDADADAETDAATDADANDTQPDDAEDDSADAAADPSPPHSLQAIRTPRNK